MLVLLLEMKPELFYIQSIGKGHKNLKGCEIADETGK